MSGHTYIHTYIHTYTHTYTHDNYYNPRCACVPRVNKMRSYIPQFQVRAASLVIARTQYTDFGSCTVKCTVGTVTNAVSFPEKNFLVRKSIGLCTMLFHFTGYHQDAVTISFPAPIMFESDILPSQRSLS